MNSDLEASVSVLAPAKINLFLSVGRPDAGGYHPIRTTFQAVGLFDRVSVLSGVPGTAVVFDQEDIPDENTVAAAIRLYGELTKLQHVAVMIEKQIPSQAGLGGGSSDAAAVLRALQELADYPLSSDQLARIALKIGADVPFFLVGGTARAEGYGELLTPLPDEPRRWLTLAMPSERCSTSSMFQKLDLLDYEWRDFPTSGGLYNDFERVAPCACLDLIERMRVHGAAEAGLTGSGSAVFGIYGSESEARAAANGLAAEGVPWVEVAPTLTRQESLGR